MPMWTNVRKVEKVEASENITPAEKSFKSESSYANTTDRMNN